MYFLDEQYEKNKKDFTPVFKECLDLIREDYLQAQSQLDAMTYLNKDTHEFKVTVNKDHLLQKVVAYRSLFPFFED